MIIDKIDVQYLDWMEALNMPKLMLRQISSIDDNGFVCPRDVEMQEAAAIHTIQPTLLFHARKTSAAFTRTEQFIHSKYNGALYWTLTPYEHNRYVLSKVDKPLESIVPNGSYIYVVLKDIHNQLSLRIGMGRHVFLAQPENIDNVVAAGDIKFSAPPGNPHSAEITMFNNNSGAFHANVGDKSVYERRSEFILECLEAVGLPIDKYIDVNLTCHRTLKRRKSTA